MLLLDEPLGALDLKLRRQMQIELKRIQTEVGITFVHVTHDQEEAMTMADTVAVMNGGVIEQMGSPEELYEHPRTTFVANFLGQSNLIRGAVQGTEGADAHVDVQGNRVVARRCARRRARSSGTDEVWVGIRPEKVVLAAPGTAPENGANVLPGGVVTDASFIGVSTQYLVRMPWGQELMVFEQNTGVQKHFSVGDVVDLHWVPDHTFLLDAHQDASAGVDREDVDSVSARSRLGGGGSRGPGAADCRTRRSAADSLGYLLLLPAVAVAGRCSSWSRCSAWSAPRSTTRTARSRLGYQMTWQFSNYTGGLPGLLRAVPPVDGVRRRWPRSSASCSATRSPTRSRSRPAAGRTSCWSR